MNLSTSSKDSTTPRCACMGPGAPDVGRATAHLHALREHLLFLGYRLEAAAVDHALDMLIPSRVCGRTRRLS